MLTIKLRKIGCLIERNNHVLAASDTRGAHHFGNICHSYGGYGVAIQITPCWVILSDAGYLIGGFQIGQLHPMV